MKVLSIRVSNIRRENVKHFILDCISLISADSMPTLQLSLYESDGILLPKNTTLIYKAALDVPDDTDFSFIKDWSDGVLKTFRSKYQADINYSSIITEGV